MIAYALILLGFLVRVMPHVPNSVPVAAIALFAGAYLDRRLVPWVPLAIMAATDLVIGLHDVFLYTWGALVIVGFVGMFLRKGLTAWKVAGLTVISSLIFFAITNFGVWLAWYPRTAQGLAECFIKALPFLRNDLAGNLFGAFVMFGSYEFFKRTVTAPKIRAVFLTQ